MITKVVLGIVGLYAAVLCAGYLAQRRLLYEVDPAYASPDDAGLAGVTEMRIPAPDGTQVLSWYAKPQPGQPTLLYFHGTGSSLAVRVPRIEGYMSKGWGVFMMAYRGYGGSTGTPTERHNVADAVRAFDTLVSMGTRPQDIVLYGESLGTGVAAQVALVRPAAALILDAPFTSIPDVAARSYWYAPVHFLMKDRYETARIIGRIRMPILIMHGALDTSVPVDMGRTLARLASEPKSYVEFPNGRHSDLYINGNNALDRVEHFLRELHS